MDKPVSALARNDDEMSVNKFVVRLRCIDQKKPQYLIWYGAKPILKTIKRYL